ncbi:hut operon transcriptional regulator HutP [Mammaliicoccus sciuri]|uniref:Hut operon positive regulatory protein n=1 Tax=Sporosarcina newyorkensis TaxID=759851 RepID=A0A1T4YKS4_9BACL|nr:MULTISPECIES: hut operon transcriptional regulator HutP [Sporosarcina]MBY0221241.1 hut operon transcriptional regulator HutP [Sporosarcina aquimarina]SKB02356.1 hut operon positive regulatory protein [Sporosarcina newyorkensis]
MNQVDTKIGRQAVMYTFSNSEAEDSRIENGMQQLGWQFGKGKVGSMEFQKIVAAIETLAKRQGIVNQDIYREMHALYHAIIEAMQGVTRGQVELGGMLRTAGLRFAIVRGTPYENAAEGEWIAVAVYGTIGAPVRGFEHEAIGLGINHI